MMHEVNGVDLTSSELNLLRELVACEDDGVREKLVNELTSTGDPNDPFDRLSIDTLRGLSKKRLILGLQAGPMFVFRGEVTQAGFDFVSDYDESVRVSIERDRAAVLHDWKIASFGVLGGLLSGAFGSWLFNLVASALGR